MLHFFFQISIEEILCSTKECQDKHYSIIHVVAESSDKRSAIHYLWSVVYSPTIIVAYFDKPDVSVSVDWKKVLTRNSTEGVKFNETSEYITALVIPAIYEFQDPKDQLYYTGNKVSNIVKHQFNNVDWQKPEIDHKNNITTFQASMLGGNVTFQVSRHIHAFIFIEV